MGASWINEGENTIEWIITIRGDLDKVKEVIGEAQKKAIKLGEVEIIE